jgi:hypothetical protein
LPALERNARDLGVKRRSIADSSVRIAQILGTLGKRPIQELFNFLIAKLAKRGQS